MRQARDFSSAAARKVSAVRRNVATNIVVAWIITLPSCSADGSHFLCMVRICRVT